MKFRSGYHFIYYMLKNNIEFSFDSHSFDYPKMSSVELVTDFDIPEDLQVMISDIEFEVYDAMTSYFLSYIPVWIHKFSIKPKLLKNNTLVFNTDFYAEYITVWDGVSPVFEKCILHADRQVESIIAKELSIAVPIEPIYFATISINLKVTHSKIVTLNAQLNYNEDTNINISENIYIPQITEKNKKNINKEIENLVASSVKELEQNALDFNYFDITLEICNAELDQGILELNEYREHYYKQIELESIKDKIMNAANDQG